MSYNQDDNDGGLASFIIWVCLTLFLISSIAYNQKRYDKTRNVAKSIKIHFNGKIKTFGGARIFYCFTHSNKGAETNINCVDPNEIMPGVLSDYNTIVTYFSMTGNFVAGTVLTVQNFSESGVYFVDNDNSNFNNNLVKGSWILVTPSTIYSKSGIYKIVGQNEKVDFVSVTGN